MNRRIKRKRERAMDDLCDGCKRIVADRSMEQTCKEDVETHELIKQHDAWLMEWESIRDAQLDRGYKQQLQLPTSTPPQSRKDAAPPQIRRKIVHKKKEEPTRDQFTAWLPKLRSNF
jgi:hypothetical protein